MHIEPNSGLVFAFQGWDSIGIRVIDVSWHLASRAILIMDGSLITFWEGVIH